MALSSTSRLSLVMLLVMSAFVLVSFELGRRSVTHSAADRSQRALALQVPRSAADSTLPRERSSLHLAVDKPIAKPGDTLFFRATQLHAFDLDGTSIRSLSLAVMGPKGNEVFSSQAYNSPDSVGAFEWTIPQGTSGGQYVAVVKSPGGAPPAQRKFEIRARSSPRRLQLQLEFERNAYAAGETVHATVHAKRATGAPAEGAVVRATARLDGDTVFQAVVDPVSADGESAVSFTLPATINAGVGQLSVSVDDGGVMETVGKTLPVQVPSVLVFPEGGDLVTSVPSRVYIEASTPWGEPADVDAVVRDVQSSAVVATVTTTHEGRGVSTTWTPRPGAQYALYIMSPPGVSTPVPLPDPKPSGVTLSALAGGVYDNGSPVSVEVRGGDDAAVYRVALFRREVELASSVVALDSSSGGVVSFHPPSTAAADGVLRVTVFDNTGIPVAERLVYRRPTDVVHVDVTPDKVFYAPGESVELTVRTTDAAGRPLASTVGLTVTDETVQAALPTRRHHPRLPVMALLEDEVAHLEDPAAYAVLANGGGGDGDTATTAAIDLLLGTQGWRRFAFNDVTSFVTNAKPDDAAFATIDVPEGVQLTDALNRMFCRVPSAGMYRGMFGGGAGFDGGVDFAQPVMMKAAAFAPPPRVAAMNMREQRGRVQDEMGMAMATGGAPPGMAVQADVMEDEGVMMAAGAVMEEAEAEHMNMGMDMDMDMDMDMNNPAMEADADVAEDMPPMMPPMAPEPMAPEPMPMPDAEPMPMPMPPGPEGGFAARPMRAKRRQHPRRRNMPRREYAHSLRQTTTDASPAGSSHAPHTRHDFTDTVYWAAALRTNADTGSVTVRFQLSHSTTAFHATADAFARGGLLGSGDAVLVSDLPVTVEARVPTGVTVGDALTVPISTVLARFGHSKALRTSPATVHVEAETGGGNSGGNVNSLLTLTPESTSKTWTQTTRGHGATLDMVATAPGLATLTVSATDATNQETDSVERTVAVRAGGFPVNVEYGGLARVADPSVSAAAPSHDVFIPTDALPGSLNVTAMVYSSPVASLTQALEALIRAPCGCFEQTASSTYPLVMAQQYFMTHSGVDPDLIRRADTHLATGYKKLSSFETPGGGFEWFGGSPAHEALTAYGALLFQDLKDVFPVDEDLLRRTKAFLRGRADGSGGFQRNARSLDSFGRAPDAITNAYIVFSLTAQHEPGLEKEVQAVVDSATAADGATDPYLLGLATGILYNVGRTDEATAMARRLVHLQDASDGSVPGAATSITCSGGRALTVEATSIAVIAWLNNYDEFAAPVRAAMNWLVSQCQNGRFGSTQATVLALKAIIAYDVKSSSPKATGSVALLVDNAVVDSVAFSPDSTGALVFSPKKVAAALSPGAHHAVSVVMKADAGGVSMPYSFHAVYSTNKPPSDDGVALRLTTKLAARSLAQGDATELTVTVQNLEDKDQPMVVAIVGLPGGVEPRHDKLRELVQAGDIAFYELGSDGDVTLYWRGMPKLGTYTVTLDVVAAVGGTYTGAASRAYLYYTDELKAWAHGLAVTVSA